MTNSTQETQGVNKWCRMSEEETKNNIKGNCNSLRDIWITPRGRGGVRCSGSFYSSYLILLFSPSLILVSFCGLLAVVVVCDDQLEAYAQTFHHEG